MSWLPKSSRRIRREAADWVARRKGNPQAAAEDDFQRWYRESDRQAEAYDRMAAIWELSGRTSAPAVRDSVNDNARSVAGRVAIAASLLAILVAGALALMAGRSAGTEPGPLLLASTIGEVAPYRLADGSQVVLDTASRVEVRYSPTRRQLVLLTGRARFTVADDARPFAVAAARHEVVGRATTFEVSLIGGEPEVRLIEGSLAVRRVGWRAGAPEARLSAGDEVVLVRSGPPKRRKARGSASAWTRHMLEFDATPLGEAIALANRYSTTQIRLSDSALALRRVSGAYRVGDAAAFARSIAVAFGLEVGAQPDGTIVLAEPRRG